MAKTQELVVLCNRCPKGNPQRCSVKGSVRGAPKTKVDFFSRCDDCKKSQTLSKQVSKRRSVTKKENVPTRSGVTAAEVEESLASDDDSQASEATLPGTAWAPLFPNHEVPLHARHPSQWSAKELCAGQALLDMSRSPFKTESDKPADNKAIHELLEHRGEGEVTRMGAGESYRPAARLRSPQRSESFRPDRDRSPRRDRPRSPIATDSWHPNPRNRSPPRRRSRTPMRRERTPPRDSWRGRARTPMRARSPMRRFSPRRDDDRRPRSPLRRDERRRSRSPFDRNRPLNRARSPIHRRSPPPAASRGYRPRSRSPDRRDNRMVGPNAGSWRRRSPSPAPRESERSSGRTSGNTSRRSSPPIHPDRLHLTQNVTRDTQPRSPAVRERERSPAAQAHLAIREKESTRSTPRERSPVRQAPRSPVHPPTRSPARTARSPVRSAPRSPARQAPRSPLRSAPRSPARQAPRSPIRPSVRSPIHRAPRSPVRQAPRSPIRQAPRSPIRQTARSPVRSTLKSPIRNAPKSPARPPQVPRSPPRGPANFRAPPTGPSGSRNFTAPSAQTTSSSLQRAENSGPVVPPSGPRGYVPSARGSGFGMRGGGVRGSFGNDRTSRPDTSSWGSAPPTRPAAAVQQQQQQQVVIPRRSPSVSRPTASPSPSLTPASIPISSSNNSINNTTPTVPTGPAAQAATVTAIPTGPRAGVPTRPPILQHSSSIYPRATAAPVNNGPRPHPATANMPPLIPGGRIDPTASGMTNETAQRLKRKEEEADALREELNAKQEKLRVSLKQWEKLRREASQMALRTELSERHVRMLAGEGVGGAAF